MRTSLSLTSLAFSLLASLVSADVKFTSPTRSSKWKPGVTVTVEWEDSGDGPSLSDFSTYTMWLCVGSNKDPVCFPIPFLLLLNIYVCERKKKDVNDRVR